LQKPQSYVFPALIVMFSVAYAFDALTSENLDLDSSFLVRMYSFKILRSNSYIKITGSRSQEQQSMSMYPVCGWFALDWKEDLFCHVFYCC